MSDEDISILRIEWSKTVKSKILKELFPKAPNRSRCKQCKKTYPNSLFQGSGIITSMCEECINSYIKKKKKKATKMPIGKIKQEELKTLKEYLEMEI